MNGTMTNRCQHGACGGTLIRDEDDWGWGTVRKCHLCGRAGDGDRPEPEPLRPGNAEPRTPTAPRQETVHGGGNRRE